MKGFLCSLVLSCAFTQIFSSNKVGVKLRMGGERNTFLARTLGSNMVFQRDVSASIYGYSEQPGTLVIANFDNRNISASSNAAASDDGGYFWKIDLPPQPGSFTPHKIIVSSSISSETAVLENVVFGDVYLCSGQSNMQFGVAGEFNSDVETASANNYSNLRLFTVGQNFDMPQFRRPLDDLYSVEQPWAVASSQSVNSGNEWNHFSAVCWEFGRNVFETSLKSEVPVGLVSSNWGGTVVEAWSPEKVVQSCRHGQPSQHLSALIADQEPFSKVMSPGSSRGSGDKSFNANADSVLYYTMIHPFRDMKIKGAVWYQGESNAGNPSTYPCFQDGMVNAWRSLLGIEFSFLYTQLSTWNAGGQGVLAKFRTMQTSIMSITPHSAMISAADLGDPESPYNEIHPRNKMEVGRRLAMAASTLVYGISPAAPFLGPSNPQVSVFNDPEMGYSLSVTFDKASVGTGLTLQPAQECPTWSQAVVGGCGYILLVYPAAAGDQAQQLITVNATAQLVPADGPNVVRFVPLQPMTAAPPVELQYCEGDYPLMTVYNSDGVPLLPVTLAVPTSTT